MTTIKTEKAARITKAMHFTDIAALLEGNTAPNGSTVQDALDFISHEIELLAKKNTGKSGKMTETQKQNEVFRSLILEFLSTQSEGVTCTEIAKGVPELSEFNNQKISALMQGLTFDPERNPSGTVDKAIVKGKSLFTLR